MRIIFFEKSGKHECLVEMDSLDQARRAKDTLDGRLITPIKSTVQILFSNMTNLSVERNTPRAWDFAREPYPGSFRGRRRSPPPPLPYPPPSQTYDPYRDSRDPYGRDPYRDSYRDSRRPAYNEPPPPPPPPRGGVDLLPKSGQVLLVSNLDSERVKDPMILFRLFNAYGNVVRVKILFNKPDTALIQFENPFFAQTARKYLDKLKFRGQQMNVTTSKYDEVVLPPPGASGADLTREFLTSRDHRYRASDMESYQKTIVEPRPFLFISSVRDADAADLEKLFSQYGRVKQIEIGEFKRSLAWVEMEDTDGAIEALVNLHDTKYNGGFLRVSFSPKTDLRSSRSRREPARNSSVSEERRDVPLSVAPVEVEEDNKPEQEDALNDSGPPALEHPVEQDEDDEDDDRLNPKVKNE
jgi:polypyrimidine tract-binding protein 1